MIENIKKKNISKYVDNPITSKNLICVPHPLIHFIVHYIHDFNGLSSNII